MGVVTRRPGRGASREMNPVEECQTMDSTGIDHLGDYLAALDELLTRSRRLIRIRDEDLAGQGWDARVRPAMLEQFMLEDRRRQVRIMVRDPSYLLRRCPHLVNLLRYFSHQLEIRSAEDHPPFEDCFVLGDQATLLVRHHRDSWRGRYAAHDPQGVVRLGERFAEAWDRLSGGLGYKPLGL